MKRLYAVAAVILLLAATVFIAVKTVNKNYYALEKRLDECQKAYELSKDAGACSKFVKDYEKIKHKLCIFVNRSVLDEISVQAARLNAAAKLKDTETFYSQLAVIRSCLYEMKADENFSALSFF